MSETWTLTKREIRTYFDSPIAYVVLTVFLLITGWFFSSQIFVSNLATLRSLFDVVPFIFLFFIPAITMSTFAEERRSGTLELLLTMPVRDGHVIAAKLLSVSIVLLAAIALTLCYAMTVAVLGDLDFGATYGGYVGIFLYGVSAGAIGIFASSLTRNQIVAFIIGFGIIFALFLADKVTQFLPGTIGAVLQYIGLDYHYRNLLRGVIDSRDVLYYVSVTLFAAVCTAYTLARRPE